jgi:2-C-methyl-D-erythritol 2,4-cyclodiphosphate synthase
MHDIRVGFGYDVHQLVRDREFWLGGIRITHDKGALGHSDADALLHAICDALLGAANLGDIGKHFPDTSSEFKNMDSKILLQRTCDLVRKEGWEIGNVDSTVCLQQPKIAGYLEQMKTAISKSSGLDVSRISIKATTAEKLGFVGREEGIEAQAVVLIHKK